LALARAIGDDWLAGWALHLLALAAHVEADFPRARAFYEESIQLRRPLGYLEGIGVCLNLLGMVTYSEGDYIEAQRVTRESIRATREVCYYSIPTVLATAACIAAQLDQPRRAARLAGATASFSESVDISPIPLAEEILGPALDRARRALGAAGYDAAWAEGRALSLDDAVDEVLADEICAEAGPHAPAPASLSAPDGSLPLTAREVAVLRLIADGRTTREIAAELFVSVPTVERHITHLYGKIGARGRAEAATYALRHGLTS
jgi:DNA-binding CsgD family transcriptional regulator